MFKRIAAVAAMVLAGVSGQAFAAQQASAQLGAVSGQVMLGQDGAYAKAGAGAALKAGDRLLATDGSSAELRYADGCVVNLLPGAMATVGAKSPCAAAGPGLVGAAQPMQLTTAGLVWGIVGLTALILVVDELTEDDDDPVSP